MDRGRRRRSRQRRQWRQRAAWFTPAAPPTWPASVATRSCAGCRCRRTHTKFEKLSMHSWQSPVNFGPRGLAGFAQVPTIPIDAT